MAAISNPSTASKASLNADLEISNINPRAGISNLPEWMTTDSAASSAGRKFPKLTGDAGQFDVVVVGGGMVGVSAAYYLKQAGKKVALIEGRRIGTGTSGSNTGKLTAQQNVIYSTLTKQHGVETARLYGEMQMQAIDEAEKIVQKLGFDCEMKRNAHSTWTSEEKKVDDIRKEYEASIAAGLPAELIIGSLEDMPKSVAIKAAVRFPNQLAYNPFIFCKEVAAYVADGGGCAVFEDSRVTLVSEDPIHTLTLAEGTIRAEHVILATHLPIMDRSGHFTFLSPSRTHCVAVRLKQPVLREMNMSADEPLRSLRVAEDGMVLIVAGESIEVGSETDTNKLYAALEDWARLHFPVDHVQSRWSAMDYISSDHLPWIGYLYRGSNTIYTATGFSKWGLTNGLAAGQIIHDLILGNEATNKYFKMTDARRYSAKTIPGMIQEGLHTTQHMIGDKIKALVAPSIDTLKPGTGGLVKAGGQTVGAFLDTEGKYHLVKPVCTHLGCHLLFNQGDAVWDCPCHGSQFGVDGDVIHGPAVVNLEVIKDLQW